MLKNKHAYTHTRIHNRYILYNVYKYKYIPHVYHKCGQSESSSRWYSVVNFKLLSKWKIAISLCAFTFYYFFCFSLGVFCSIFFAFSFWFSSWISSLHSHSPVGFICNHYQQRYMYSVYTYKHWMLFNVILIRFIHCLVIDFWGDAGIQWIKWKIHTSHQQPENGIELHWQEK